MSPCAHDIDILTLREQCLAFWYSKRITVLGKSFISSCLNNMQFCPTRAGSLVHCAILTTNDMDLKKDKLLLCSVCNHLVFQSAFNTVTSVFEYTPMLKHNRKAFTERSFNAINICYISA